MEKINQWAIKQKMKLNVKKAKTMIFNFSKKHQFSTIFNIMNTGIDMATNNLIRHCNNRQFNMGWEL